MTSLFFLGQVVLGAYFIVSGVKHFTKAKDMIGYAAFKKLPMPSASVYISGLILLFGGIGILTQTMLAWSYGLIALFLLVSAITIHNFWTQKDAQARMNDTIQFQKNIALAAALLMLAAPLF